MLREDDLRNVETFHDYLLDCVLYSIPSLSEIQIQNEALTLTIEEKL